MAKRWFERGDRVFVNGWGGSFRGEYGTVVAVEPVVYAGHSSSTGFYVRFNSGLVVPFTWGDLSDARTQEPRAGIPGCRPRSQEVRA